MAYELPCTIAELMNDMTANKYILPSTQREYVWSTEKIKTLFDSVLCDYSIVTSFFGS